MKKAQIPAITLALVFTLGIYAQTAAPAETTPAPAEPAFTAGGAATRTTPARVTVTHMLGTVEIPYNPQRIAILDMSVLDMLDVWGLGDRVVGMPKDSRVSYLMKYAGDAAMANLGNLKEVDMEELNSLEPDVIFIGARLSAEYARLSEIAPVVLMTIDNAAGYMNGFKANVAVMASLFGKEAEAAESLFGLDARIAALNAAASGKTMIVGMVTSSSFHAVADGGRCSVLGNEVGFKNLADRTTSGSRSGGGGNPAAGRGANPHGDSASFELLIVKNHDYIFVLDRDAAIGTAGSKVAQEVMENELVQRTDAYQNGQIVYLTSDVWYLAEGGITATDIMLRDLETGMKNVYLFAH